MTTLYNGSSITSRLAKVHGTSRHSPVIYINSYCTHTSLCYTKHNHCPWFDSKQDCSTSNLNCIPNVPSPAVLKWCYSYPLVFGDQNIQYEIHSLDFFWRSLSDHLMFFFCNGFLSYFVLFSFLFRIHCITLSWLWSASERMLNYCISYCTVLCCFRLNIHYTAISDRVILSLFLSLWGLSRFFITHTL